MKYMHLFPAILLVMSFVPVAQSQTSGNEQALLKKVRVRHTQWPLLAALGKRLEKPGKERVVLIGQLKQNDSGAVTTESATIVFENPGLIRVSVAETGKQLVFNGQSVLKNGGNPNKKDSDLIESFVEDSVEGFFFAQQEGRSARLTVRQTQVKDPQQKSGLPGVRDVYFLEATQKVKKNGVTGKSYYFDSVTRLLAKVRYLRDGKRVETRFGKWQAVNGELVPGQVSRYENGELVFEWVAASANFAPSVSDGLFTTP